MPLYSEDTEQRSFIPIADVPSTFSEVVRAQFESTKTELPGLAIGRMAGLETARSQGQRLGVDEAELRIEAAGLQGHLKADDSLTDAALDILIERKQDELKRADILSRGRGGFGEGSARLGVALATSLLDPLNIGLAFVPVIGPARYAKMLAAAGGPLGRAGVRAGVGAVEGTAGAVLAEPFIYSAKLHEQADYDMADSLLNVAFGSVFGSGLHVVGGASVDMLRSLRRDPSAIQRSLDVAAAERAKPLTREIIEADGKAMLERADTALELGAFRADGDAARLAAGVSPEVRQSALRVAEGQAMAGRPVDVEPLFAGERGVLPDGTDTGTLTASEFTIESAIPRKADIAATLDQRIADLDARAAAAGDGTKPRYALKDLREIQSLKAYREAVEAVDSAIPTAERPAAQVEAIRQAAVVDAIERGVPVPQASLEGLPESFVSKAAGIKRAAVHDAAKRHDAGTDSDLLRQEEASRAVDDEISKADEVLEAAEEEAAFAEQMVKVQAKRYGLEVEDSAMSAAAELTRNAERWSRIADAAAGCLVRGA